MKARDPVVVAVLRTTLAAIDNAEAVQAGAAPVTSSSHIAGASAGVGSSDVPRRALSADEIRAIVRQQAEERRQAAEQYEAHGRVDQAHALRREAAVLDAYWHDTP